MPELVCDTSALQYLHQMGMLHLLRELGESILVPSSVVSELEVGRKMGIDLPQISAMPWLKVCDTPAEQWVSLVSDMGPGEAAVLMHTMASANRVAVLDDAVARARAASLQIPFTGTLGLLLDAKTKGIIPAITPCIEQLEKLGFRIALATRNLILKHAGEASQSNNH